MKTTVIKELSKYIEIQDQSVMNKILWWIKWRADCYTGVWFSRHEFAKFWTTENKLRKIIEIFRQEGLFELVERREIKWKYLPCCIFVVSDKLQKILDLLKWWIENLSEKIKYACNSVKIEYVFDDLGIIYNRVIKKLVDNKWRKNYNSTISYSRKLNVITNWLEWKTYNIYSYLKDVLLYPTDEINNYLNIA